MAGGPGLGPVVITAREVYDAVMSLKGSVDKLVDQHADAEKQLGDHEARLRVLERARWPLPSLAVLVSLAAAVIAAVSLLTK